MGFPVRSALELDTFRLPNADVVIEVSGGTVVAVYSDLPDGRIVLVDWDELECGAAPGGVYPHNRREDLPDDVRAACTPGSEREG
jgi:hypothetical protein